MAKNHTRETWIRHWEKSFEHEDLTILGKRIFDAKRSALSAILKSIDVTSIIDVGCGAGHILELYVGLGYECLGIDIAPCAVELCRKKGLPAKIMDVADVNVSFDLVSSDGVLEHFLDFKPHAEHLMRISRRYVLLLQPNRDSFTGKTLGYLAEIFRGDKNVHEYNFRIHDFIRTFEEGGFVEIKRLAIFFDAFKLLLFEKRLWKRR